MPRSGFARNRLVLPLRKCFSSLAAGIADGWVGWDGVAPPCPLRQCLSTEAWVSHQALRRHLNACIIKFCTLDLSWQVSCGRPVVTTHWIEKSVARPARYGTTRRCMTRHRDKKKKQRVADRDGVTDAMQQVKLVLLTWSCAYHAQSSTLLHLFPLLSKWECADIWWYMHGSRAQGLPKMYDFYCGHHPKKRSLAFGGSIAWNAWRHALLIWHQVIYKLP